jgi:Glycosyltransferase family 87
MNGGGKGSRQVLFIAVALVCASGTWLYASWVLIPHQVMEDTALGRPRGNFSDLYPRWLGARELLLHKRNPYGDDVTREIQAGYYGRPLDGTRVSDPRDEQGFAYPVYVAFILAPIVRAPFAIVQRCFFWFLVALTGASVMIWYRALRWPVNWKIQMATIVLVLGSLPVMQGLKLQQMSLFVAGMLAIGILLMQEGHPVAAGIVLALATIKPQLMLLVILWLAIWTSGDWWRRYRWCVSFVVSMTILFAASEWYLPHWMSEFWHAIGEYRRYADAVGVVELLCGPVWGRMLEFLAVAAMLEICWKWRKEAANSDGFAATSALVLALTALLVPKTALYNDVLLIPAVLSLVKERRTIWRGHLAVKVILVVCAGAIVWPWIASLGLAWSSFLWPRMLARVNAPFWTAPLIPVGVAAGILAHSLGRTFAGSHEASTS